LRDGPRRFPRDFSCPVVLRNLSSEPAQFHLRGYHPLWPTFPGRSITVLVAHSPALRPDRPYNPDVHAHRFGLFRVRSPLLAESLLFSFPAGTEMVHFPALPSRSYEFRPRYGGMTHRGFPHSDIPGSTLVCSFPRLIAAYRVLHRLLAPRHSPYALSSLTIGIELMPTCLLAVACAHQSSFQTLTFTLLCLWIGKTTVCRIFSCKRTPSTKTRVDVRGDRSHRGNLVVENTGLEPVTSWLQTRRSPS
jgi:hypothetical protein